MLKIAVCDDQAMDLKILELHLREYRRRNRCGPFDVDWFTSSAELVERLQGGRRYDLFILDMMMPEYNGVEVGRAIRADGLDGAIIYITATADFALDAISVHPEQYLLKPLDPEALYQALDAVVGRKRDRERHCLTVKTREGIELLPCGEIVCVEHAGRVMRVYTADGAVRESVYLRASFESLVQPLLRRPGFIMTHKSYVVSLAHVRALQAAACLTDTGMEVPVSRRNAAEVRQQYLRFLAERPMGGPAQNESGFA